MCTVVENFVVFLDLIDIATRTSFIFFRESRKDDPTIHGLQKPGNFSLARVQRKFVRNFLNVEEYFEPPVYQCGKPKNMTVCKTEHTPTSYHFIVVSSYHTNILIQSAAAKFGIPKQKKNKKCFRAALHCYHTKLQNIIVSK